MRRFKFASLNVRNLTKHIDELRVLLADCPIDILAINEHCLIRLSMIMMYIFLDTTSFVGTGAFAEAMGKCMEVFVFTCALV